MNPPRPRPLRLTIQKSEAALMLGVSIDSFEKYVQAELPVIRRGNLRLYRLRDLERWVDENAALTVGAK